MGRKIPHQREHFFIAAQRIGHPATGQNDAVKVGGLHVADRGVAGAGVAVLAGVGAALHRAGDRHVAAGFLEPEFRVPEFEILVSVADEHEHADAIKGLVRGGGMMGHGHGLLEG
jgi:hypothetical protein